MSHIIWDPQAFDIILTQLREASGVLEQCQAELRAACRQGEEILGDNSGVSRTILAAMNSAMKGAGMLAERADTLRGSMTKVQHMVNETESKVRSMMEEKGAANSAGHGPDPLPSITSVLYTNMAEYITGIVPQWLMDAANEAFSA